MQSRKEHHKILNQVFGYQDFKPHQEETIESVLRKKDTLAVLSTGGGKSISYQIPAIMFSGVTIVVSPLISLMKNQVDELTEFGVPASLLNSSISQEQKWNNLQKIKQGKIKIVYVAPETLLSDWFLEKFSTIPVEFFVIDEAHCISSWGHQFRPEYREINKVRELFPDAICLAVTATATDRVRADIINTLNFENHKEIIGSFNRENLYIEVAERDRPISQIFRFLESNDNKSGIIYCFTRAKVDKVTMELKERGYSVAPYHGGLSSDQRKRNQEAFLKDDVSIIVATIAFGMGINKSNIRFVIHHDLPKSIESYYQEIGRAGRDGLHSHCLFLFSPGDYRIHSNHFDELSEMERDGSYKRLNALIDFAESQQCRRIPLLSYFGEERTDSNCGMCDICTKDKIKEKNKDDITLFTQKFISCILRIEQKDGNGFHYGATYISKILRGSVDAKLLKNRHDSLSTYNIGGELTLNQWKDIGKQLVQKGYLNRDIKFQGLSVTNSGREILSGKEKVMGELSKYIPIKEREELQSTSSGKSSVAKDDKLFQRLRIKRKEIADRINKPAFIVFSDKTLIEMANRQPKDLKSMLDISGVGSMKLETYGDEFLGEILKYLNDG